MKISQQTAGSVTASGALTHSTRKLTVVPPEVVVSIRAIDLQGEDADVWGNPLASDKVVDLLVESYRGWLVARR